MAKRLMFQPEFNAEICGGVKTGTIRKHATAKYKVGDKVSATNNLFQKAIDGFCTLQITEVHTTIWRDISPEHLSRARAGVAWYEHRYGDSLSELTLVTFYGFRVLEVKS